MDPNFVKTDAIDNVIVDFSREDLSSLKRSYSARVTETDNLSSNGDIESSARGLSYKRNRKRKVSAYGKKK